MTIASVVDSADAQRGVQIDGQVAGVKRRIIAGWSIRWDEQRAADAGARGFWTDGTIATAARRRAEQEPDATVLVDGHVRLNAASLYAQARHVAQAMIERGLEPGQVVGFMLPNWHEAAIVYLATALAGLVVVPILPNLRDKELRFILEDVGAKMLFVPGVFRHHDYRQMVARVSAEMANPPETVVVRGDAKGFTSFAAMLNGASDAAMLPAVDPDGVRMVMYTSGTTGRPKGVLHTHNSLNALVHQLREHWRIDRDSVFFVPSPVSHIGGSIYAFEIPLLLGATAVLQDQWDPADAATTMKTERATHMAGATPFLTSLLAAARATGNTLPDLRLFICGGASVPPTLVRDAAATFENCAVSRVYGSTEVPVVTVGSLGPDDCDHAADTDGKIGIADVRLIDAEGQSAEEGEVLARGPQMLAGYLHPEDEEEAFDADGYFRMGDRARRVHGDYLVISGRAKDIIIRNGENIAAKEIEDLLMEHPDIADIAIVGLPDPSTGERACAVIVPAGGAMPDVGDVKTFLEGHRIARFKIPEQVELVNTLPRNAAGKILKAVVRANLLASETVD